MNKSQIIAFKTLIRLTISDQVILSEDALSHALGIFYGPKNDEIKTQINTKSIN